MSTIKTLDQKLSETLFRAKGELLYDVKVIPVFKQYKTDGTYWTASRRPMSYVDAIDWLQKEVRHAHDTTKSWVGDPEVKLVASRGLVDWVLKHPKIPENTLFKF